MDVTENDIDDAVTGILKRAEDELSQMSEAELRQRFHFQFDGSKSARWNLYHFTQALELYRTSCRRWEEMHNGHMCVVERVRDKYLMPRIDEFLENSSSKQ